MNVLGWDIGGANLKASNGTTKSVEASFPLWKQPEELTAAIGELAGEFDAADLWVITMTGELADCFASKREGVDRILNAAREASHGIPILVWTTAGEFVPVDEAMDWPLLTAASNWLALATWAGRMVPEGNALVVDTGSTTTDIIPLLNGFPDPQGRTDVDRLQSGELVYTGWKRTPLAAIAAEVTFRGRRTPLAAELFATTWDIHLLTGAVPPSSDGDTANGRPAGIDEAWDRLSRMLCCDRDEMTLDEARVIAGELADRQTAQIARSIDEVVGRMQGPCPTVIVSGSGAFLARWAVSSSVRGAAAEIHSLNAMLGDRHATAACAFALARLAAERIQ
ncbi:Hydantoinase/oxoprolinase [Caulifigura coniformis]|uniref:Hydantoinase/oxoprolinase n=1 Tax=Caulifigura coniformis TaxID=2527983 RepID=A0A517SI02_9PLAN|nr:hydantoinase/oxoprolinase family protein [Caulifigura coniformis]QDT55756.1 Hydantoinase/oxoprolinase [Caulifigura coniformis]